MGRLVAIVPHTHWDREWYLPFQTFRLRLVGLLDELLPRLDADPSYRHFLLDGQMAVVDDYLEVRPEAAIALTRLACAGRVAMGPWYTLPDEFLVSGETHIRNLQRGLARAAAFGGAMEVGYLPDMFGHIAQMPQLLRQFGFEHAVVWRGVPNAVDRSAFIWRAPDGSTVRAEYLVQGYGNGAHAPDSGRVLVDRIRGWMDHHRALLDGHPILWMNGTDHELPQPWLGRVVDEADAIDGNLDVTITSLAEYLAGAPTDDLPAWQGELRSGARANLLMGVTSNRTDVRQASARAERLLEREAEPLAALWLGAEEWPAELLDEAWLNVIRNAAHDSVCACSIDEVCDAVLHRYAEAAQIARGLVRTALVAAAAAVGHHGPVIVNPSARTRGGLVELTLPAGIEADGTQLLRAEPAEVELFSLTGAAASAVFDETTSWLAGLTGVDVRLSGDGGLDVLLRNTAPDADSLSEAEARVAVADFVRARPEGPVRARRQQPARQVVLARTSSVPGFGWMAWAAAPLDVAPVTVGPYALDNGLIRVEVDATTGTWSLGRHGGLGRLVDGGDAGDTYNHCPPGQDRLIDQPDHVTVEITESGPLRARLAIDTTYTWPERVDDSSGDRVGAREVTVRTALELRAGERFVRVETSLDNPCRDHRLRIHFPLPSPATHSRAECAFAVVERGLTAEGGPTEPALPTYPSRRFVQAGGLTFAHEGLPEYELIDIDGDGARTLAVTLLRATGWLSRGPMPSRPLPAGPEIRTEGSQIIGPLTVRYAVSVDSDVDPYALVDDAFVPLLVADGTGAGSRPPTGSHLWIHGAEVSAVRRVPGALEVRVFNPTAHQVTVSTGPARGWLVDLRGRPLEPIREPFELGPWRMATVHLTTG